MSLLILLGLSGLLGVLSLLNLLGSFESLNLSVSSDSQLRQLSILGIIRNSDFERKLSQDQWVGGDKTYNEP